MNIFLDIHRQLVADMLAKNVQFILIGGYAVNYHGYNRTTGDLDVWLKPDNENKIKILKCLESLGIDDESIQQISELDFTHALVFSFGDPPYKTDFLTRVSGVRYDEADKEKIIFEYEGLSVPFISLNHLVLTKITTGRNSDRIDIEKLQEVAIKRNKTG